MPADPAPPAFPQPAVAPSDAMEAALGVVAHPVTKAAEPLAASRRVLPEAQAADAELVAAYLAHGRAQKRWAGRTLALYALELDKLQQQALRAHVALRSVTSHHVRGWAKHMQASGRSARGMALTLSVWRGLYAWLGRAGHMAANPVGDVHAPSIPKRVPKAMAVEAVRRLADHTVTGDPAWVEVRDAAIVELLYGCGLRVGELVGLDVVPSAAALQAGRGWVDLQADEVQLQGKGGERRSVPLGRMARKALLHWLSLRTPTAGDAGSMGGDAANALPSHDRASDADFALFLSQRGQRMGAQGVAQRLRRRARLVGLSEPVHPNMLRHACASHVLQSSQDVRAVQALMGHAQITSTQNYARLDFSHLTKTYAAAHPRAKRKPSGPE